MTISFFLYRNSPLEQIHSRQQIPASHVMGDWCECSVSAKLPEGVRWFKWLCQHAVWADEPMLPDLFDSVHKPSAIAVA